LWAEGRLISQQGGKERETKRKRSQGTIGRVRNRARAKRKRRKGTREGKRIMPNTVK